MPVWSNRERCLAKALSGTSQGCGVMVRDSFSSLSERVSCVSHCGSVREVTLFPCCRTTIVVFSLWWIPQMCSALSRPSPLTRTGRILAAHLTANRRPPESSLHIRPNSGEKRQPRDPMFWQVSWNRRQHPTKTCFHVERAPLGHTHAFQCPSIMTILGDPGKAQHISFLFWSGVCLAKIPELDMLPADPDTSTHCLTIGAHCFSWCDAMW